MRAVLFAVLLAVAGRVGAHFHMPEDCEKAGEGQATVLGISVKKANCCIVST